VFQQVKSNAQILKAVQSWQEIQS